jgi:serine/threonine protein kinase
MSESPSPDRPTAPSETGRLVDEACDRFAGFWLAGQRPRIEDFLEDAGPRRAALLRELLRLELVYRRQNGEAPAPDEYRQGFAQEAELVRTVFAEAATLPPGAAPREWPAVPGFEILAFVDSGGQGDVYRARQAGLDRVVAVKVLRPECCRDPRFRSRFRREGRAVARLDHPNVVRVFAWDEHDGRPYLAMEFLEGGSLRARLARGPLPPQEAAQLLLTLARAVAAAHRAGVVHRDLKPGNVLFKGDGTPVITDFGLAKRLGEDTALTVTGTVMGTASYMAPEQAAGKTDVAAAADVYGLGAILYEALAGRPPFRAPTRELTIIQVLSEDPDPPSRYRPDMPGELEAVCLKCLEKEPDRRYPSAEALAEDLQRFLDGEPVSVGQAGVLDWNERWARRAGNELLEVLSCGRTGFLYKAWQMSLNRVVALKLVPGRGTAGAPELARFRREAEVIARLHHPHIVQIFDFGERNGQPYFVMEFVDGQNLGAKFVDQCVPAREAAALVATLARAMHYAHSRGVIHCALKPASVLLTPDGTVKITRFGLARLVGEDHDESGGGFARSRLTSYMAPEQVAGRGREIGPATDVYALGATLYKLLTGRPPFLAETLRATSEEVLHEEPVPPRRLQAGVATPLEVICLRCLRKEPPGRYPSALDLAVDLERFLAESGSQYPL